ERLGAVGLPASSRVRRGRGVVTAKGNEGVGLFLGRIGGGPSLLELEARQVARTLRGELNRVLNAESANLGRSVAAARRQLAPLDRLHAPAPPRAPRPPRPPPPPGPPPPRSGRGPTPPATARRAGPGRPPAARHRRR